MTFKEFLQLLDGIDLNDNIYIRILDGPDAGAVKQISSFNTKKGRVYLNVREHAA